MLVIVRDRRTQQPVNFNDVNINVPVPISKDPLKPCTIKISEEYYQSFSTTIVEQGWYVQEITN